MKRLSLVTLAALFAMSVAPTMAYEEVECASDAVFSTNTCSQCFVESDTKSEGDNIGLLSDLWLNNTTFDKIMYKEEQEMPEMLSLSAGATWSQTPSGADFWEYTDEFDALYSEDEGGYILPAGKEVTWLKSKLGYAYKLTKNEAVANQNVGLLVYPVAIHNIIGEAEITPDNEEHRECVLFKSAGAEVTPEPTTEEPTELPQTGPENYLFLMLIALILAYGISAMRRRS